MTLPEWWFWLPLFASGAALTISVMTYFLAIQRDQEARDVAVLQRQLAMISDLHQLLQELDKIKLGSHLNESFRRLRHAVQKLADDLVGSSIKEKMTRQHRTDMEDSYKLFLKLKQGVYDLKRDAEKESPQ